MSRYLSYVFVLVVISASVVWSADKKPNVQATQTGPCKQQAGTRRFTVDAGGNVSDTGRSFEGPACVEVLFNPILMGVSLQSVTTVTAGPDQSKTILGGPSSGGAGPQRTTQAPPTNLLDAIAALKSDEARLNSSLNALQGSYATVFQSQEQAISDISSLRRAMQSVTGEEVIDRVKNGYIALQRDLRLAVNSAANFVPSDRSSGSETLLAWSQRLEDTLARLPLDYPNGAQTTFTCLPPPPATDVAWGAWYTQCKDSLYTPLKALLDADLANAKSFAGDSDSNKALKQQLSIVTYWNSLFSSLGLTTDLPVAAIQAKDITPFFFAHVKVACGPLFNQSSSTNLNILTADLGPTLAGNDPNVKAQTAFATVTCGNPFTISAGAGFNTIEQKQFAIIQASDGKGGVQNVFGVTSDAKITPVALAITNIRLTESDNHKIGFYGSLGVGGSLTSGSGGSSLQFLPGVSVALWRTMYITGGVDIGTSSEIAGGFKVGDIVPAAITSVLTSTSHSVRFGFAITFTKP